MDRGTIADSLFDHQIIYYLLSFKAHNGERVFHYLFTIGLFVGMAAYFAMASDLGFSVIRTTLYRSDDASYQMFWAKYVYWVVAWPVLLIALGLISGVSWTNIVFNIFLAWSWYVKHPPNPRNLCNTIALPRDG